MQNSLILERKKIYIAKALEGQRGTVTKIIQKHQKFGSGKDAIKCKRPRKTDQCMDRTISIEFKKHPFVMAKGIRDSSNLPHLSKQTIRNRLISENNFSSNLSDRKRFHQICHLIILRACQCLIWNSKRSITYNYNLTIVSYLRNFESVKLHFT